MKTDQRSEIIEHILYLERKAMEARVAYTNDLISYRDYRATTDNLIAEQRRLKEISSDV